ncbi:DUF4135 domain-containing protein [Aerosakkonema funiforme]|uniref:DUF4135 domain-containing protein n=1 Tax=Aerosakkonema funiforme TaxID=1246630 RepID=UPI0035BB750E
MNIDLMARQMEGWKLRLTEVSQFTQPVRMDRLTENKNLNKFYSQLKRTFDRLHQGIYHLIQTSEQVPFVLNKLDSILLPNFLESQSGLSSCFLALELQLACWREAFGSQTAEEKVQNLLKTLFDREVAIALLQENPFFADQFIIHINNWVNFSLEFIQHLCIDWDDICISFSSEADPGLLIELRTPTEFKYQGSSSVMIAKFSNDLQLIYQPSLLSAEFLTWLTQKGNQPPCYIERCNYSWVEFIKLAK